MAYFLGYNKNNIYEPINLDKKDILEIIRFTSAFKNSFELNYFLKEQGLIDDNKNFVYLIDKGSKGNKTYHALPYNKIYYTEDKESFNIKDIKKYIFKNINNQDFLDSLYAYYIKKVIGISKVNDAVFKRSIDLDKTKNMFNKLYSSTKSDTMKKFLLEFGIYFTQNRRVFDFEHSETYQEYINNFLKKLPLSDSDLVHTFEIVKSNIKEKDIPLIKSLSNMYNNINEENIMMFLNNIFYVYDKKTKEIKIEDDHLKFNSRGIADLGAFISTYKAYQKECFYKDIDFDPYEKEEFLTDEDYELTKTVKP